VLSEARLEPEAAQGLGFVHAVVRTEVARTVRSEEVESVIDVVRTVREAGVAAVLKQDPADGSRWQISLRSAAIDVSAAAAALGEVTVCVAGEVDLLTSKDVDAEFTRVLGEAPDSIVVDMSAVSFCDSTGLTMLVKLNSACIASNRGLRIIPSPTVRKVIDITGLAPVLPISGG